MGTNMVETNVIHRLKHKNQEETIFFSTEGFVCMISIDPTLIKNKWTVGQTDGGGRVLRRQRHGVSTK